MHFIAAMRTVTCQKKKILLVPSCTVYQGVRSKVDICIAPSQSSENLAADCLFSGILLNAHHSVRCDVRFIVREQPCGVADNADSERDDCNPHTSAEKPYQVRCAETMGAFTACSDPDASRR